MCFAIIVLQMYCYYKYSVWLFLTVPWVGLQCVIMVFPDFTQLLFRSCQCEEWRSKNAEKVTHIKGRLLYQAVVLFSCYPFPNGKFS